MDDLDGKMTLCDPGATDTRFKRWRLSHSYFKVLSPVFLYVVLMLHEEFIVLFCFIVNIFPGHSFSICVGFLYLSHISSLTDINCQHSLDNI